MLKRLVVLTLAFFIAFVALISRLFYWQIIKGQSLSVMAREQYKGVSTIKAARGEILASDGSWLAATSEVWLLFADIPNLKDNPDKVSKKLAPILVGVGSGIDKEEFRKDIADEGKRIFGILTRKDAAWAPIRHKISSNSKKEIEDMKIKGIGFEPEEEREYPEASMAAQVLGFVGKSDNGEDQGYFGLEGYYNMMLSGKPGYISRDEDVRGIPILLGGNTKEVTPVSGVSLITHIDKSLQLSLDNKLKEGIEKYGAVSGTGIIMEPKSGAILAMSSFPSYDPSKYFEYKNQDFINSAISSTFEPGSVFKVLVMASALDAGVIEPDTKCTVCSGPFKVDGYSIGTWNNQFHPDSTMTEVIVNSDNVGMAYVGSKLGIAKMYDYLSSFGIGSLTGIDLQGEATAKLRDKNSWSQVDLATASFGQGVAVTPIQMARAVAAIANNGIITTPQVVGEIKTESWEDDIKPVIGKRVISDKAAKEITAMMIEAAKHGESKWTDIPGFKVAGKTGTAQIPIKGHYDQDKTIASFVGFAPYDDPKFVMLITLQEPKTSPWASETAAPLWYSIAKDIFGYMGIQPEN